MTQHSPNPKPEPAPENRTAGDAVSPAVIRPGDDVNVRAIARFGVGLAVSAALVSVLVFVFVQAMSRYEAKSDPFRPPMEAPRREAGDPDNRGATALIPDGGVRLQREPFLDIEQEHRQEDDILNGPPRWVDEKAGVVRLPIARAMTLLVDRGLPVRVPGTLAGASSSPASTPTARPAPGPKRAPAGPVLAQPQPSEKPEGQP
jgi:hypothetical protein